tara:strand:- start:4275 stop:4976 length:702 start_codon:yes stop_codon:yes gene_type:complete
MAEANLKIDWATHESAKYACKNWHYSKSIPVPPLVKVGVWENSNFIGVVMFSRGASSNLMKPYGLTQDRGCELTRIALTNHITPVSRIVKIAIAFLKKNSPNLKIIISFADPQYGHHGGIYQAGNWDFIGSTNPSNEYWHKGRRLHSRQVSEKGWNIQQGKQRKTIKPSDCQIIKTKGKYRYVMPLDAEMRKRILPLAKPYPKRAKQAMADDQLAQRQCNTDPHAPLNEACNG